MDNVLALAQFAALYGDRVLIRDPFGQIIRGTEDLNANRDDFLFAGEMLLQLMPLIRENLVSIMEVGALCTDCYLRLTRDHGKAFVKSLDNLHRRLIQRLAREAKFTFSESNGDLSLEVSGPEELVGHGFFHHLGHGERIPGTDNKLPHVLSRSEVIKWNVADIALGPALDDLLIQNFYSTIYGHGYLTESARDFQLISELNQKGKNTPALMSEKFAHAVPAIANAPISLLLKVRSEEGEAFQVYRDSLSEAIAEAQKSGSNIDEVFMDVVRPEINKLDVAFKNSRKLVKQAIGVESVTGSAVVGVSLFGGILPVNISAILAALGGAHYTKSMFSEVSKLVFDPPTVRDNKFYFLWKLNRKARKRQFSNLRKSPELGYFY